MCGCNILQVNQVGMSVWRHRKWVYMIQEPSHFELATLLDKSVTKRPDRINTVPLRQLRLATHATGCTRTDSSIAPWHSMCLRRLVEIGILQLVPALTRLCNFILYR